MVRRRARSNKVIVTTVVDSQLSRNNNGLFAVGGAGSGVAVAIANGSLLDDQYFASPKRKDCKIDNSAEYVNFNNVLPVGNDLEEKQQQSQQKNCGSKVKSSSPSKTRAERVGRIIGVPLATRSQTRTIEKFFNTAARNAKLKKDTEEKKTCNNLANTTTNTNSINAITLSPKHSTRNTALSTSSSPATSPAKECKHALSSAIIMSTEEHHSATNNNIQADYIFDLSEDTNDTDTNTEYSDEVEYVNAAGMAKAIDFTTHRSTLRDSHSSSRSSTNTDNIFLQEPVLTLNVDKSAANQASAIKINKSLEIEPIFSSPPASLSAVNTALNGRFNQIVSLNGSPSKRESFGFESKSAAMAIMNGVCNAQLMLLPDNDNSSCDSGIAFTSSLENSPLLAQEAGAGCLQLGVASPLNARRRKPATPHRIVCPSPIKAAAPRMVSPAASAAVIITSHSGRKIPASKEQLSPRKSQRHLTAASSKTRRRLNHQKDHTGYSLKNTKTANNSNKMLNGIKQNGYMHAEEDCNDIVVIEDDDDEDERALAREQEFENLADGLTTNATTNLILNSAKHITAQKSNTNYNNNNTINIKAQAKSKTNNSNVIAKTQQQQQQQPKMKHQATHPLATTNGNRELTEFFPVRRSVRKTKTAVKEEMMRNLEQAVVEERAEGLKIAHFEGKGRGIISDRPFQRGEFVVEYVGDLISMTEATEREKRYALDENAGCYMYYFKHKNQQYCIDATVDTGKLGRLVNHSRNGNLITKVVVVKQIPHLILVAKDDIMAGEELTYDYGDRSKESLLHHPWLAF